jgi:hypothetical protein
VWICPNLQYISVQVNPIYGNKSVDGRSRDCLCKNPREEKHLDSFRNLILRRGHEDIHIAFVLMVATCLQLLKLEVVYGFRYQKKIRTE